MTQHNSSDDSVTVVSQAVTLVTWKRNSNYTETGNLHTQRRVTSALQKLWVVNAMSHSWKMNAVFSLPHV
jgi:hypothetical protein